jgi:hypothetical protein
MWRVIVRISERAGTATREETSAYTHRVRIHFHGGNDGARRGHGRNYTALLYPSMS